MTPIHKLIIRPRSAATACGTRIGAYYPMSDSGLSTDGRTVLQLTITDTEVTCEKCSERNKGQHP